MKRCPQCGTTYTDASLRFCLADGAALVERDEPMRVDIPSPENAIPSQPAQKKGPSLVWILVALGVGVVGLMAVAGVIVLGILFYIGSAESEPEITAFPTPTPAVSPGGSTTDEERIKQELEKLEKKLAEMEKPPIAGDPFPDDLDNELGSPMTATVNSPNDGFLALRSLPSTEIGDRLATIPHGTQVEVIACDPNYHTLSGRKGRWCLLVWDQSVGWAFDAWLTF
jgi:hypothetical protein